MAMTADGKIATANRRVSSFGSKLDRENLFKLRAQADAIMVGARTADSSPVNLGPGPTGHGTHRVEHRRARYSIRVIVSGTGTINPNAEVFRHRFSPIIILTTKNLPTSRFRQLKPLAEAVKVCGHKQVDFKEALRWLHEKWGVKRLLCEGGGQLNDALFRAGVVDELHLTICPIIFGGRNAATIADGVGVPKLSNAAVLRLKSLKRVANEVFLVYEVLKKSKSNV